MDINYAVLMPPPRRSAKRLQFMILGGVGLVALTAVIVAVVVIHKFTSPEVAVGSGVSTPATAMLGSSTPTAATPSPEPTPAAAPAKASPTPDTAKEAAPTPAKKRAVRRRGRRGRTVQKAAGTTAAPKRKSSDDELRKLLGI